jgi:hypothetical protein
MPANSSGWFWHSLARETGKLGHLYSPGAERGPWPWLPYAFDNGAFSCWNPKKNTFNHDKWATMEIQWRNLLLWGQCNTQKPLWALVPDVPGQSKATLERWDQYHPEITKARFPLALAVQDGMTYQDVKALTTQPEVIFVGGSTDWKWETIEAWTKHFPRVHVGRCNSPQKLDWLEKIGVESCDGTGWNRGDKAQTSGLETWLRKSPAPNTSPLWPYVCKAAPKNQLTLF